MVKALWFQTIDLPMPLDPTIKYDYTKHGNRLDIPKLQPGYTINYDGFGLMVLNGDFLLRDNESPDSLESMGIPLYGEEVIKGSGLYVAKISKTYNRDKTITVSVEAIGIEKRFKGKTNTAIEGMATVSAEPIETHPNFRTKLGGTPSNRLNGATFDGEGRFTGFAVQKPTTPGGQPAAASSKDLAGVRSYLSPKVTVRGTFHVGAEYINGSSDYINRAVGLTTRTGEIMGLQFMPEWYAQQNTNGYLLTSATPENVVVDKEGKPVIVKITFEMMRAAVQWDPDIYTSGQATK